MPIARECDVDAVQQALARGVLPFDLVKELAGEMTRAEHEPVAAGGALRLALLQEAAVRRHAGARTDHDHVTRGVVRQAEALVGLDEHAHGGGIVSQAGQMRRGCTEATVAVALVVDDRDREVRLLAHRRCARGDRVQARGQRTQGGNEGAPASQCAGYRRSTSTSCRSLSNARSRSSCPAASTSVSSGLPAICACCSRNGRVRRVTSRSCVSQSRRLRDWPSTCDRLVTRSTQGRQHAGHDLRADFRATRPAHRRGDTGGPTRPARSRGDAPRESIHGR